MLQAGNALTNHSLKTGIMKINFDLTSSQEAFPVAANNRIRSLDVLRGVAVLGILLMNIPEFSMPGRYSELFRTDMHTVDFWIRAVIMIFWEGKMRALFSLLFGAGILLFILNKKTAAGTSTRLFYQRMFWLVLLGLADAHLLLWDGDILYYYGIIGMIAFLFRKLKPQYLVLGIPLVAAVEFIVQTSYYQGMREKRIAYVEVTKALSPGKTPDAKQQEVLTQWRELEQTFIPNDQDIADNTRIMKSDYSTIAAHKRKQTWILQTSYLIYGLWDPLALMLLGMALFKWGFLTGEWTRRKYLWTAIVGYGLGLPLVIWDFCYSFIYYPDLSAYFLQMEQHPIVWMNLIYPVQRILLVMAHAAVIMLILRSGKCKQVIDRLSAVGQMALTNYVMQSVICTLLFFGYGLNLYATLQYSQIFYVVAGIWLIQLFISQLWLKYFHFGPLEWLWRTLTYWKIQPMRKRR